VSETSAKILIVEDDLDVADMLNAYFNVQGYDVETANWGEDAVRMCQASPPRLVILDIRLPDIDGFEVARRLRRNRRTANVPIIFLTEKRARSDRLQGLELGADDYITKPFDVQELRLRVRNALARAQKGAITNPVTNLPEGTLVDDRLSEYLTRKDLGILLLRLNNLDAFREMYGFVASDDVLRAISLMASNTMRDMGTPADFIGQLTQTDFIIITQPDNIKPLAERLLGRIEQSIDFFYPLKDRGRKEIQSRRLGVLLQTLDAGDAAIRNLDDLKARLSTG
jgi:DNA-binding response OmpR family regulator